MSEKAVPKRRYARRLPAPERREHLLDCALRVLVRDGYEAVTVEAIAREAGVTRPVIYDAYGGLAELLEALLDRTRNRALSQVMTVLHQAGTPDDVDSWVINSLDALAETVQQDPDVWRPILGITRDAPSIVRERIDSTREVIRSYLEVGLEAGIQQRGGPYVDTAILSHIVLLTAEEFGRLMLEDPPRYTRERLVESVRGLLVAIPPTEG